jgi:hypothetical protein
MKRAAGVLAFTCVVGAGAACLQPVNDEAALDPRPRADADAAPPSDLADASSWLECQSPSCDEPGGTIPFLYETPPIYLPDGGSTTDPCAQMEGASVTLRQTYCATCHGAGAGAGQGGFNYVLDDAQLASNMTTSATFPSFVVPGSPYTSYLYVSVASGAMPPASVVGGPQYPVPTAADVSMLYGWIAQCFPGADGGYAAGGGDFGPPDDAGVTGEDAGGVTSEDGGGPG